MVETKTSQNRSVLVRSPDLQNKSEMICGFFQKPLGDTCFFAGSMDRLKRSLVADETGGIPTVAGRQSFLFLLPPHNGSIKEEGASVFFPSNPFSFASTRCDALKGCIMFWPRRIARPAALRHNYAWRTILFFSLSFSFAALELDCRVLVVKRGHMNVRCPWRLKERERDREKKESD